MIDYLACSPAHGSHVGENAFSGSFGGPGPWLAVSAGRVRRSLMALRQPSADLRASGLDGSWFVGRLPRRILQPLMTSQWQNSGSIHWLQRASC